MAWLTASKVLPLAGYTPAVPPAELSAEHAAALAFAEQVIEARTGLLWGSTVTTTITVRQSAATYILRLPRDTVSVDDVSPAIASNELYELTRYGLEKFDASYDQLPWAAGTYRVEVTHGITEIPEVVTRAAALLAAHHLSLADPERSRYDGARLGDFSGTERRDAFPVPAAEQLLRPWISNVAVA